MNKDTILFFQANSWNHDNQKQNGLIDAARRLGLRVQIVASPDIGSEELTDMLSFWNPLGSVIDCGNRANIPTPSEFGNSHVVYLDCDRGVFGKIANCVCHDTVATTRLCARELLKLGFNNFAYIGHYDCHFWSEARKRSFCGIIRSHGFNASVLAPETSTSEFEFRQMLEDFLRKLPRPCGLMAVNDHVGEMVIVAANRINIRIPDELAVISIDNNTVVCESLTPTLSSIAVNFYQAGELAAGLLAHVATRRKCKPATEMFGPTGIIHRASSRLVADHDSAVMIEHIRKNALSALKAGDVTMLTKGSRRNAEKKFRKALGHSILDEIHAARIGEAKRLLSNSDYQTSAIANMCGYSSESYFRKLFRRTTGLSPLTYRKRADSITTK